MVCSGWNRPQKRALPHWEHYIMNRFEKQTTEQQVEPKILILIYYGTIF